MSGRQFTAAGLFAGVGGMELGMSAAGHHTALLVENAPAAAHVLKARFPEPEHQSDARAVKTLPRDVDLVVAGFPCQDLSSVGRKLGIAGTRSRLVGEVLRLAESEEVPWLVLENVPFLLSLDQGSAMTLITRSLTELGYRWAYRVVDSNSFGLPQRRNRWYLVASKNEDPRDVLLVDEVTRPELEADYPDVACGFYWTEGMRALGWAVDAIPPIKVGSSIGVASPPAIRLPSGTFVTPDIRDAERLQGFPEGWTEPALEIAKMGERWRMVGNAASVPAAAWIGRRLAEPGLYDPSGDPVWDGRRWSRKAAWANHDGVVHIADLGPFPVWDPRPSLVDFLRHPGNPLSARAALGFLGRTEKGTLRFVDGFREELRSWAQEMAG